MLSASIIIPTYDQEPEYLVEAVASALSQTVPVEVIIVDDGSADPVDASRFPGLVRVFRHPANEGISAALNTGMNAMETDWFCWLSSDDLLHACKVETQRSHLEDCDGWAGWHRYYCGGREMGAEPWRSKRVQDRLLNRGCRINGSTVMVHRSVFDDVGPFDPTFRFGQDWEMWCRIGRKYFWHGMDRVLGTRREDGNLTARIEADPSLRRIRDHENLRILREYAGLPC